MAASSRSSSEIFDQLHDDEELVEEPFARLIALRKLIAYKYERLLGVHGHLQGQAAIRRHERTWPYALGGLEDAGGATTPRRGSAGSERCLIGFAVVRGE